MGTANNFSKRIPDSRDWDLLDFKSEQPATELLFPVVNMGESHKI